MHQAAQRGTYRAAQVRKHFHRKVGIINECAQVAGFTVSDNGIVAIPKGYRFTNS
jgi:hypothetical protein